MTKIVLINESKRTWSFPSLPFPEESSKLDDRGKPSAKSHTELVRVKRFGATLEPRDKNGHGGRVEVPEWYFRQLLKITSLRPVFGRQVDGIAVGMSNAERLAAAVRETDVQLREMTRSSEEATRNAERRASFLERDLESANAETERLRAELAKLKTADTKVADTKPTESRTEKTDKQPPKG